jgi:hypothetical protein
MRLLLVVIVLSAMICDGAYAQDGLDIVDGMVSAWLFTDGLAVDYVGNNNGIIRGGIKAAGKYGDGLSFDGVDDYVEIPDDPSLHLPEALTVAAWININSGLNHAAAICWKGEMVGSVDGEGQFSWCVCTTSDASMMKWGRCTQDAEKYFATDNVIPGTGEWVHVAMTCLAPGAPTTQRAYVNGEDITDRTGQIGNLMAKPPFLVFDGIPVEIGVGRGVNGEAGNDVYFDGMIDDVVVYNRGLTAAEISELMNTDLESLLLGGVVTGGGWIDSPSGAYAPNDSLTGKANFGFVSMYKKGASVPTGQTEFHFQVADLNFHSDSYDWLVVNQGGTNAQYKGSGTIN